MIELKNISKTFNNKQIIKDLSLTVMPGEILCISGQSGSGKTTLLNIIAGIEPPDKGQVFCDDKDISTMTEYRQKKISYMACGNILFESMNVMDNIQLCMDNSVSAKNTENVLRKLQIDELKDEKPRELSAGEYKRVCLARSILQNTPYIILDEPTSNLDQKNSDIIINMLKEYQKKGIVIATHDMDILSSFPQKIIKME